MSGDRWADVPQAMREAPRWVLWRYVKRGDKLDKVPRQVRDPERNASSTDPATWGTFEAAMEALPFSGCDGPGFVLGEGWRGVDLDSCRDPDSGELAQPAARAVDAFGSYAEVSPSGTGVKIITRGDGPDLLPSGKHGQRVAPNWEPLSAAKAAELVFYTGERYFCVTGEVVNGSSTLTDGARGWLRAMELLAQQASSRNGSRGERVEVPPGGATEVPSELLRELEDGCTKAGRLWRGEKQGGDTSRSGMDASLACVLGARGYDDAAVEAALRRYERGQVSQTGDERRLANLIGMAAKARAGREAEEVEPKPATLDSFYAYAPMRKFIYRPDGEPWPASSVNDAVPPVKATHADGTPRLNAKGEEYFVPASAWLGEHRQVQQMTWAPGEEELIENRLIVQGGWKSHPGASVYNLYDPPRVKPGDPDQVGRWLKLLMRVYPDDWEHLAAWMAHRVQRPQEKINHAIVMGGAQGVGKDTLLEPLRHGVGPWNFADVSPHQLMGRFNGFLKSVVLLVSETRDLGESNRFSLYEHMKVYTAAPPETLRVDEKNIREYCVPNLCGVVVTTNKRDGLFLPPDDRRHYVAWSPAEKTDFDDGIWSWYDEGGVWHVVAYLQQFDLAAFNPKAPPPKTEAFWQLVDANRAPEDDELTDALELLGNPAAVTVGRIGEASADASFKLWLGERKNAWAIRRRMDDAGYVSVRNQDTKDGYWKIGGKRQAVYARQELSPRARIAAARALAEGR